MTPNLFTKVWDPRYFHLILFPTEKCSFRCKYCYEDFSVGRMAPELVQGVKRLIEKRVQGVKQFEISWFGGEPLLAKDIIFDVQDFVQSIGGNFDFSANMTTNGFALDVNLAKKLCERGVRTFQISLDGSKEYHDVSRVGKGGFPTFDRIMGNLLALRELDVDFKVLLRLHYHPGNVDGVKQLVRKLVSDFCADKRFKIHLKSVNNLGGPGDTFVVFDHRARERLKLELEALISNREMLHSGGGHDYVCYAARLNSLAIRADGRISKCTVALTDPKNTVGRLDFSGRVSIDKEKLRYWARGAELEGSGLDALRCPLHAR